jgi:hypothetical protein
VGVVLAFCALEAVACGPPDEEAKPRPLPEEARELEPGTYRTEEFEPALSFEVGGGWTNQPPEADDQVFIEGGHGEVGLGFANIREVYVYKPTKDTERTVVEAPEDMVGWLLRHPHLRTSGPEQVEVGGIEGVRFDLAVGDLPEDHFGECGPDCVALFRLGGAVPVFLGVEDRARFIVLEDVEGQTVVIGFVSLDAEFNDHAPEAQKVLNSVEWRGG